MIWNIQSTLVIISFCACIAVALPDKKKTHGILPHLSLITTTTTSVESFFCKNVLHNFLVWFLFTGFLGLFSFVIFQQQLLLIILFFFLFFWWGQPLMAIWFIICVSSEEGLAPFFMKTIFWGILEPHKIKFVHWFWSRTNPAIVFLFFFVELFLEINTFNAIINNKSKDSQPLFFKDRFYSI